MGPPPKFAVEYVSAHLLTGFLLVPTVGKLEVRR